MITRKQSTLWTILLLSSAALAGCTDGDGGPQADAPLQSAAPADFDDATGGIEGLVLDDEQRPVSGAEVGVPSEGLSTVTDAAGAFSFSNVPPGSYDLHVQRLGYEPDAKKVTVVAGQVLDLLFTLTPLAVVEPFVLTLTQRGIFGCGASWNPGIPPEPGPGTQDTPKIPDPVFGGNVTDGLPNRIGGLAGCGTFSSPLLASTPLSQYDQFSLEWLIQEDITEWQTGIFEMHWTTNQLAGRGLRMSWEVANCFNRDGFEFSDVSGGSPLRGVAGHEQIQGIVANGTIITGVCDEGPAECYEDLCRILSRVFATEETTGSEEADVGVSFQQQYEMFLTAFFLDPAPEDYTALAED